MSVVIIHLSDIHIKTPRDEIMARGYKIASSAFSVLSHASHVFVIISGDIAYSGKESEYLAARGLVDEIVATLRSEAAVPVSVVTAPGNHDCDFDLNTGTRELLVSAFESSNPPNVDESMIQTCTEVQRAFFSFRRDVEDESAITEDDRLWRTSNFKVEGKNITIEALNISWVSKKREEPGRLYFPIDRYRGSKRPETDLRIVVLHHPLNWFSQSVYRPFRTALRQMATILVSGHEHQGNVGLVRDVETEESAFVEGCVLQGDGPSSFNLIVIDVNEGKFTSTRYEWRTDRYEPTSEGSWTDYHDLPQKKPSPFAITPKFQGLLDDPGAFFKHPGGMDMTLSDIFVYPDLRRLENGDDMRRTFVSASKLLASEVTSTGVMVVGQEKAGSTSLLYHLYRQYHARGFVPLFLKGKELRKIADSEIDRAIKSAVTTQYGRDALIGYEQLPSSKKFLLLDDFDDTPVRAADARAGMLCSLRKRFGHVIVTAGETFELQEVLDGDASRELAKCEHYQLQPFGYALRAQLIERWFSLGSDGTVDEETFIARCDQAERLMDAVMTKMVIPSLPLYLLTLLQSMDAGRSGDFKDSALGYYYQYLLTEAFQASGVRPEKLTEVFHYASQLAWQFHVHGRAEMSEADLRAFNEQFSKDWVTVDFHNRVDLLLSSRVLCHTGDDYSFRYPYIYYYLKGQFLSENLGDLEVRAYIARCCEHLYVREHANTVLFLAHHTNDEYVLNCISGALHKLFRNYGPVAFGGDTAEIDQVIEDAPKLVYAGGSPTEHRRRRSMLRDKWEDGSDGLAEKEEKSDDLSGLAQMTMLIKTVEILGQVLKNQYAKISRTKKAELIEELLQGPMRALRSVYDFFTDEPDALVGEIEAALEKRGGIDGEEERRAVARKTVAGLVQLISFGFVTRAAQAVSAETLSEDVARVVKRNGTLAFKLMEMCTILDSPKALPRARLKALYQETENDMVAARLLRLMVLNRLYMFKTTERDMQWLYGELRLDIGGQHAITYHKNRGRLVKGRGA